MSLALQHKKRILAKQQGQPQNRASEEKTTVVVIGKVDTNAFEALKQSLESDLITLKHANGAEERDPFKTDLIGKYREYAEHLMTFDNWKDLTVLFYWLMWRLDIEGFEAVQADMLKAVEKGLNPPVEFKRDFVTIYLDEMNNFSTKAFKEGEEFNDQILTDAIEQLNSGNWAINASLKSKLHAIYGKVLHKKGEFEEAVKNYTAALNLNDRAGVKTVKTQAENGEEFNG